MNLYCIKYSKAINSNDTAIKHKIDDKKESFFLTV